MYSPSNGKPASTSSALELLPIICVRAVKATDRKTAVTVAAYYEAVLKEKPSDLHTTWNCGHRHRDSTAAENCGQREFARRYGTRTKRDRQDATGQRRFA